MKSVLIAIQPKWCKLISEGKKTVEVRKTKPKLDVPFKCYIYCTKDGKNLIKGDISTTIDFVAVNGGKVIGEFVCDSIDNYECELWNDEAYELIRQVEYDEDRDIIYRHGAENNEDCEMLNKACLTWQDIRNYLGDGINNCYAWHITDLVIYEDLKELFDFLNYDKYQVCKKDYCFSDNCWTCPNNALVVRPPQSWCYVEELGV